MNPVKVEEIETLIKQKLNITDPIEEPIQLHIAELLEEPMDDPQMPLKRYSLTD
jgi:hypothetical protein